jgi:hypothetical protein
MLRAVTLVLGLSVVDAGAGQYYGRSGTPFGTIAALMRWADMQTVRSSETVEVRASSWFGRDPAALIRLIEAKGSVRTEIILWWPSGNSEVARSWPTGADVQCDAPKEGPATCVKVVASDFKQDWNSVLRDLRQPESCYPKPTFLGKAPYPISGSTHQETLQMQISNRGMFSEFRCSYTEGPAGPLVSRTLKLLRDIAAQAGY